MTTKDKPYVNWRKSQKRKKGILLGAVGVTIAGAAIGTGYAIWHGQQREVTAQPLAIEGLRDLAVPFRKTYEYKCQGGELSIEGKLPEGFTFNGKTLEYTGTSTPANGSFQMKATANDGKNIIININYYGVDKNPFTVEAPDGIFIMNNGDVKPFELVDDPLDSGVMLPDSAKLSTLGIDGANVKSIYFKGNDIKKIGNNFNRGEQEELLTYPNLTSIDFSSFKKIETIGRDFMSNSVRIVSIDLSSFKSVTTISDNFLGNCLLLTSIDLSSLENVSEIGRLWADDTFDSYFLARCEKLIFVKWPILFKNLERIGNGFMTLCKSLTSINLSAFENVEIIDGDFMTRCSSLTSIDLSSFKKVETIGHSFLLLCDSLTSVDLSAFKKVKEIGFFFMGYCSSLTSIDLSTLTSILTIGVHYDGANQAAFLAGCTSLQLIKVGSIDFTNKILVDDAYFCNLEGVENVKSNKIIGSKSKEFYDQICLDIREPISKWTCVKK